MAQRFLVSLFLVFALLRVSAQTCDIQVVTTGERCAGTADGTARVVINGQVPGLPASCLAAETAPAQYTNGCTSTYSSNTGEVLVSAGQQVCLTASNFTGGIQVTGGTLVISGSATPAYMNLNSTNPAFTLVILNGATAQFSSLNLFGSSTVKNYGTLKVPSVGFNGTLENNGVLQVTGDMDINAPYGNFTNKGAVTISSNFNNYNTTLNGGTITVSGTINNNSNGTLNNLCTITAGGDLNNNKNIINKGYITVSGKTAMNGSSQYQGYGGARLTTAHTTVDGIVQGMSSSCSSIKVSGNSIINSSAVFSGQIDFCDANGIETSNGTFSPPASKNCSCTPVTATYAWQSPLSGTQDNIGGLSAGITYSVQVNAQGCTPVTKTFTISSPAVLSVNVTPNNLNATAVVSGGTAPYTYIWSNNPGTGTTVTYATSGTYSVQVTDSKGCTASKTFTVTAPPPGNCVVTVVTKDPTCAGSNDGKATIYVDGNILGPGNITTGTPAGCSAVQTSPYTCTTGCSQTVSSNTTAINVSSGQQVCLTATAYTSGINVTGGTLVICGKATPQYINYNTNGAAFTMIVNGELTLSSLNLPASCTLKNYGKVTFTSSVSFNGRVENYGTMSAAGDFNDNASTGKFFNYSTLTVASNLNNNIQGENYGTLTITGNLQNNGGSTFTNACNIQVGNEFINNANFTNNGNITVAQWTRLNGSSTTTLGAGTTLQTGNLTLDGTVTGAGNSCSALKVNAQTIVNGSGKLQGRVSLCDANGIETFTGTVTAPATKTCSCILQPIQFNSPLQGGSNPYTGLPAGTYTVTVQTESCAAVTKTFTITDPQPITASVAISGKTATVTASGGRGALRYTWTDGSSGSNPAHTFVNNGSYQVTVSDTSNCSKTIGFTIPVTGVTDSSCTKLLVEYIPVNQVRITCICAGSTQSSCTIINSTGTSVGSTIPQPKNDSIVQVKTGTGTTIDVLVQGTSNPPYVNPGTGTTGDPATPNTITLTAAVTPESCTGKKDGAIQLTITGGSGDYVITNNYNTQTNNPSITSLGAGQVRVHVFDNKSGYIKDTTLTIGIKPANSYQLVVNTYTSTGEAATVSVQATGGISTANTTVQWSTGATGFGPVAVPSWLYTTGYITATISESWACPLTLEIPVVPSCTTTVVPALSKVDATCYASATGQVSITNLPSGGSVVWSGMPGTQTGTSVTGLLAGTYRADVFLTLSNGNKCKAGSAPVTVGQPSAITVNVIQQNNTGTYVAQVSGGVPGYTYQWSNGTTTASAVLSAGGFYQVQVQDTKGCPRSTQLYIPVQECTPGISFDITRITCLSPTSGKITASSTISGASYYWNGPGISNHYTAAQENLGAGVYAVTVTGWNPQCQSRAGVRLVKPAPLKVVNKQSGGTVSIVVSNGTPNYNIVWRFDNKKADSRSDLTPGVKYIVDITDSKGCSLVDTFTYNPCAVNPVKVVVKMSGATATPEVSGGISPYTYAWVVETAGGNALTNPAAAVQNNLDGIYRLTVTDTRGCTGVVQVTGPNCGMNDITVTPQNTSCKTACDGRAELSGIIPAGAVITWDKDAEAYSFIKGCAGTHTVQIQNQQGCYVEKPFTITAGNAACVTTDPEDPKSGNCAGFGVALQTETSMLNRVCASDPAFIDMKITGGLARYHISWDVQRDGSTETETFETDKEDYSNPLPGNYTIHVSDQRGCTDSKSVRVEGPAEQLVADAALAPASCPETLAGITFSVKGGKGPYTVTESSSPSFSFAQVAGGTAMYTINPAQAGSYTYTLTDGAGCKRILTVALPAVEPEITRFTGGIVASQLKIAPGDVSVLSARSVSGYTVNWTGFAEPAKRNQTVSVAGTYTVTYTRSGCTSYTRSITVIAVVPGGTSPTDSLVKRALCTATQPIEIPVDTVDHCREYKRLAADAFAQYRYELYAAEQKRSIRNQYIKAVMATSDEHLNMNFTDKEEHYTLYYYDQSGNLVRTVPPAGVKVLTADETTKAIDQMTNGSTATITKHDYTTTYAYNSLNQLVHQDIPDHERIDLWQTAVSSANLNGGAAAGVAYAPQGNNGLMIANTTDKAQILSTTNAGSAAADWTGSQNIGLGKITSISRTTNNTVYAAGTAGTFLKSTNGGRSWSLLPLPTTSAVKQIYFSSELNGWLITEDGSMYTSGNGGYQWVYKSALKTAIGTTQTVRDASANVTNGNAWVISTQNRLFVSTDNGTSWTERTIDAPTVTSVAILSSGIAAAGPQGTVFTTDAAVTNLQVQRTSLAKDITKLLPAGSNTYYVLTTDGLVYYSTTPQTWTQVSGLSGITALTSEAGVILAYDGVNVRSLSAGNIVNSGTYKRVRKALVGYVALTGSNTLAATDGAFANGVAFTTTGLSGVTMADLYIVNTKIVVLGTNNNVYEGTVSGTAIDFTSGNPKYTGVSSFLVQGTDLYLRTTTNTVRSYSSGTQTITLNSNVSDVALSSSTAGYAVESGKVKKITSGALASTVLPLTASTLNSVTANNGKAYAAGANGELYVSTGGNFSYVPVLSSTANFTDAVYSSAQGKVQLVTATQNSTYTENTPALVTSATAYSNTQQVGVTATAGEVLVAADGSPVTGQNYSVEGSAYPYLAGADLGKIWYKETGTSAYAAATVNILPLAAITYASNTQVYAVGKQGTILSSSNGGGNWKLEYNGTANDLTAVSASGSTVVAIGTNNTTLYRNSSGVWAAATGAPNAPTAVKAVQSTILLTAGTSIYKSTNSGQNFAAESITTVPTATLRSIWLDADGYGFAAGDAGMAYRITPGASAATFTYTKINTDADITDDKGSGIPAANLKTVQFSDRLTGYITGTTTASPVQGFVLKTVDGGYHWKTESSAAGAAPQLALSSDAQRGTLIAADGSVQNLNDQAEQFNSRFWYDELGRLVLSQNAKQFYIARYESAGNLAAGLTAGGTGTVRAYSYTLYDKIGRITEVGEILTDTIAKVYKNESQVLYADAVRLTSKGYKHQVTATYYDKNTAAPADFKPTYLRNRVAYTTYQQEATSPVQAMHYSYDVHGNVNSLLQIINHDGNMLAKRVDYDYDLISGKVNKVLYQKDQPDQLIHVYTYDGDNRITAVKTSIDDVIFTKEAAYDYYAHGPMARTKLGELNVETENFAYTLQGWIKQMQAEAFSYALGYNENDYKAIGGTAVNILATPIAVVNSKSKGLYNGNIAAMTSKTPAIASTTWQQQYSYDQLNRITGSNTPGAGNAYKTNYSYDANGNIKSLGRYDAASTKFDTLVYNYETKANGYLRTTNKLRWVDDLAGTSAKTDDIEDQNTDNYSYDAVGNLLADKQEEIDHIEWTVSGKVRRVVRTPLSQKPDLEFEYDASGQRIVKKVIKKNGDILNTYYLRDVGGNVMSIYSYNVGNDNDPLLSEQYLYGSSRLAVYIPIVTALSNNIRSFGRKSYELSDHLGNVRATLSDYRRATQAQKIQNATDYYPFGMVARLYTSNIILRFGYGGQEKDTDIGEGLYTAEYWQYDTRLGKRWNIDPMSDRYPWQSPYSVFNNNPIYFTDPLGLEGEETQTHKVVAGDTYGALSKKYNVKVEKLREWNGYPDKEIPIGANLIVSNPDKAKFNAYPPVAKNSSTNSYADNSSLSYEENPISGLRVAAATSFTELIQASLGSVDVTTFEGSLLKDVIDDAQMQNYQMNILDKITQDPRYGKEAFELYTTNPEYIRLGPQNKLGAAFYRVTWTMRHTGVKYWANVDAHGNINIEFRVSDVLDLAPNGSSAAYDVISVVAGSIYHTNGILGGNRNMQTRAQWTSAFMYGGTIFTTIGSTQHKTVNLIKQQ